MSYFSHLLSSKGASTAFRRLRAILRQVGPTSTRMARTLDAYMDLLDQFDVKPTFPTPAAVVYRHPDVIHHLLKRGAEIAIHGYHHVDFTTLTPDQQRAQVSEAVRRFRKRNVPFEGFRAPYLRWDDSLIQILREEHFSYDSSLSIFWDVLPDSVPPQAEARLARVLNFYDPLPADEVPSLPSWEGNLLRLPVSLPDDEILVDRLGMEDGIEIGDVWRSILQQTYARDELFVLQLHPERFHTCRVGLRILLEDARRRNPPVWIAPLAEVAQWWRQKQQVSVRVLPAGPRAWRLEVPDNGDVTLLARGVECDEVCTPWADPWQRVEGHRVTVYSATRPTVGLSAGVPDGLVRFLRDLGYIVEPATSEHVFIIDETSWSPEVRAHVLERLANSHVPLVRLNRWPGQHRSALAVTGDLDALTWFDFLYRVLGV